MEKEGIIYRYDGSVLKQVSCERQGVKQPDAKKKERRQRGERPSPYKSNGVLKARPAEPLELRDYARIREYFLHSNQKYKYRNCLLVTLGVCIGKRCGDLLDLLISDVLNEDGSVKDRIEVFYESKTNLATDVKLNPHAKQAISDYIGTLEGYHMDDYLFQSHKRNEDGSVRPITVQQAWNILTDAADVLGLDYHVSTHSMRKTFASLTKAADNSEAGTLTAQKLLRHKTKEMTSRYTISKRDEDNMVNSIGYMLDNVNTGVKAPSNVVYLDAFRKRAGA